ncbi:MAG: xanthine dehydrogenase family protein molybdopterin-binding subunit [Mycobacteriaceae bacterium]|nr:xanthine dehydrogenase family protein molybdopterin-binding subunit [Mycobacteriaceae bacterium]
MAFVVADTFEQARAAAGRVVVEYASEAGSFDFAAAQPRSYAPKMVKLWPADTTTGDFDSGFAAADVTVDEEYTTGHLAAQPLEPHACFADWDGGRLTLYVSTQVVAHVRARVAATLRIDPEQVHVQSPFIGGAFGAKAGAHAEVILAALATRELRRPVKVAMTRQQMFQLVGNRPATRQHLRLGATRDGVLTAIAHDANVGSSPGSDWPENPAVVTRAMYAAPHRLTQHRLIDLDIEPPDDVRCPGAASGLLALESAMDELAHALNMDPVALRIRNEPTTDPERGVPFSQRRLVECMHEGASRFGWERRASTPATVRDGQWLVGRGMAACMYEHIQGETAALVRLAPDGTATVQSDMTDIGTGTYTTLSQVAADALDIPIERVRVQLGSSEFPQSGGSVASWGAGNSSNAVYRACEALREQLRANRGRIPAKGLEATGSIGGPFDDPNHQAFSIHTYGAQFAEVGVDVDTGEIRLRRMVGVFSVGRVLNAKTARSQLIGAMTWGASHALLEEAVMDPRTGAFVNRDLAGYLVPVHADIPEIDAVTLDGYDDKANAYGVKGAGEIGVAGAGAAIANAVFNATGVRVREFPITLEKVLSGLPG